MLTSKIILLIYEKISCIFSPLPLAIYQDTCEIFGTKAMLYKSHFPLERVLCQGEDDRLDPKTCYPILAACG